jgi:hypothetical protein
MSMFLCYRCDNLRDSDDGCEEGPGNSLICVNCMGELEEQRERGIEQTWDAGEP